MGTTPAIHLWTVREENDLATTLFLEVFTQRNFTADFFRQKLNFSWPKQQNRVLCHPLGDLRLTYTVHLWFVVGKRVVDFLLALIDLFSPALTGTFSRFDTIPACDRHTDRQTDR